VFVVDCIQGFPEWFQARLGIQTASEFKRIITSVGLEPSKSADAYINQLVSEWLSGNPDATFQSKWMARGHDLEDEARNYYTFQTDNEVTQVGFCMDDAKRYGCSPDGLIGEDGGLEIKVPSPGVHTGYLLGNKVPTQHRLQVLGNLLVTGRKWWDFCSYDPNIEPLIVRTHRKDVEDDLKTLEKALIATNKKIYDKKQIFIKRGFGTAPLQEINYGK